MLNGGVWDDVPLLDVAAGSITEPAMVLNRASAETSIRLDVAAGNSDRYRLSALVLNGGAMDDVPLLDVVAGSCHGGQSWPSRNIHPAGCGGWKY